MAILWRMILPLDSCASGKEAGTRVPEQSLHHKSTGEFPWASRFSHSEAPSSFLYYNSSPMRRFNTKPQKQQKRPRQLLRNNIEVGTVGQACDSSASVLKAEIQG